MRDVTTTIYALCEPGGAIRYIGKARRADVRFKQHLHSSRRGEVSYKANWIRSLLSVGNEPSMILLGECDGDGADAERYQIWLAKRAGVSLTNGTDGGDGAGGHKRSIETCLLIAALAKARMNSRTPEQIESHRAAVSRFFTGRKQRPEVVARRQATRRGYKPPPEVGRKISAALTGRGPHTPEHRAKISAGGKGRKDSPESVAKRLQGMLKTRYGIERTITADDMRNPTRYRRKGKPVGERNGSAKTTAEVVLAIRSQYVRGVTSMDELGRRFGLKRSQVSNIVNRKSWTHV